MHVSYGCNSAAKNIHKFDGDQRSPTYSVIARDPSINLYLDDIGHEHDF